MHPIRKHQNAWRKKLKERQREMNNLTVLVGFPGGSAGKESTCNAGDMGSILGLGRSWRRKWLPTPVFWPGEFHGLYSSWGRKESKTTERLSLSLSEKPGHAMLELQGQPPHWRTQGQRGETSCPRSWGQSRPSPHSETNLPAGVLASRWPYSWFETHSHLGQNKSKGFQPTKENHFSHQTGTCLKLSTGQGSCCQYFAWVQRGGPLSPCGETKIQKELVQLSQ